MKVFLAGEGPTDLGEHFDVNSTLGVKGVLVALLDKIGFEHEVVGAVPWKKIRSFRAGGSRRNVARPKGFKRREHLAVLQLRLMAKERSDAEAVIFMRDRDRNTARETDLEAGLAEAVASPGPPVAGGMAVEETEAWILAWLGDPKAERYPNPKLPLESEHQITTTDAMCAVIEDRPVPALDEGSSLRRWLGRVKALRD